jgi:hypothetical protein
MVQAVKITLSRAKQLVSRGLGVPVAALEQGFGAATEAESKAIVELRRPILTGLDYHGLSWDDEAYVRWRFFAPQCMQAGESSFLALRDANGGLLGGVGIDRVELFVAAERHEAIRLFDIMVQPEVDGRGLGVLLNLLALERYPIGLVVGDNPASQKLLERLFVPLLELECRKQLFRSRAFVERYVSLPMVARGTALALDVGLKAYLRARQPAGRGVELASVHAFDEQIDQMSARIGRGGATFVHRTGGYLNWRFVDNPRADYRCYVALRRGQLCGYVVTRLGRSESSGVRLGTIVDWLAEDDEIVAVLLSQAARHLRESGADVASVWCHGAQSAAAMHDIGFVLRPDESWPFYLYAEQSALKEQLLRADRWILTAGDYDVD